MKLPIRAFFCFAFLLNLHGKMWAQNEAMNWYFGFQAGLTFSTNPPSVINTTSISFPDGGISISDSLGHYLFCSDGAMVYNQNQSQYSGLLSGSATRMYGALAVKKSWGQYHVFTLGYVWPQMVSSLRHAVISTTAAANTGSIVQPSTNMSDSITTMVKLAGVKHCNGVDTWVVTHDQTLSAGVAKTFYAYLVTTNGPQFNPVVSPVTVNQPYQIPGGGVFNEGILRFSPNGRKAVGTYNYGYVELYDFDPATGQFSNPIKIDSLSTTVPSNSLVSALSAEFSPDGSKLYVSYAYLHANLCQFDLSLPTLSQVRASKYVLNSDSIIIPKPYTYTTNPSNHLGLQMGIDGKVYCANFSGSPFISYIAQPNLGGAACGYSQNAIVLGVMPNNPSINKTSTSALPHYVSGLIEIKPEVNLSAQSVNCATYQFDFDAIVKSPFTGYQPNSVVWNFGDTLSGTSNASTLMSPLHQFSSNGQFTVSAILYYSCGSDTIKSIVTVTNVALPQVSFTPTICKGESLTFTVSGANSFSINAIPGMNGTLSVQPLVSTVYTLTMINNTNCQVIQTRSVTVNPCAGLTSELKLMEVNIYPNPANDYVYLECPVSGVSNVLDITGQVVDRVKVNKGTTALYIENYAAGLYFIELRLGESSMVKKMIKVK